MELQPRRRHPRTVFPLIVLAVGAFWLLAMPPPFRPVGEPAPSQRAPARFNILFVLTDDQRWDTLCPTPDDDPEHMGPCEHPDGPPMPTVMGLKRQAVNFANAFSTYPLCCPARASFLKGGVYAHRTGIRGNLFPVGGAQAFAPLEASTVGTVLQAEGYRTALVGAKYLNAYEQRVDFEAGTAEIPPGWDRFAVVGRPGNLYDEYGVVVSGGQGVTLTQISGAPLILDWERLQAEAFIDETCPTDDPTECVAPFFLFYSTYAPHIGVGYPPRYNTFYDDYQYKGRAYFEAAEDGLEDKPTFVRREAARFDEDATTHVVRAQLRRLRWLDDNLAALLARLHEKGLMGNTIIVFSSDNGYHWGEHARADKSQPYEESLRVPLFIYHPDWAPRTVTDLVAMDLDVAPTIMEIAGVGTPPATDGLSLLPLGEGVATGWRDSLLIQGSNEIFEWSYPRAWVGIRSEAWKYVEYITGERELYALLPEGAGDDFEQTNLIDRPEFAADALRMQQALAALPRPLAITTMNLPAPGLNLLPPGVVGKEYGEENFRFQAWGGAPPYTWALYQNSADTRCRRRLPPGLLLDAATGQIQGTPRATGRYSFCIRVTDASIGGMAQPADYRRFELTIQP